MERSADWMDQALGDLEHARSDLEREFYDWASYPNAHPSGSPRRRYTRSEAERMVAHAEQIIWFCKDLLSTI